MRHVIVVVAVLAFFALGFIDIGAGSAKLGIAELALGLANLLLLEGG